ncbi:sensor histidine kinase [Tenacibaculum aiptasiae]|uniref:sensor histidine kinase n=1 Tax=Tenacibaculum aiptasiae TaxID=426481 RepID=UPI002330DCB5|nr:HAMP domain-containing sensor histidine kinase [Tenacibaculum aiptasiae]
MANKTIRTILLLMLITILGLFVTQVYWFKKSFSLEEKQFDDKINIALRNVAHQLLILEKDSISTIPPVTKIASNEFLVKTNTHFNINILDKTLRKEFYSRDLNIDFDYNIIKSKNNEIILGNTIFDVTENTEISCEKRTSTVDLLDFKIIINNKTVYLLNSMGIWMYSSVSLLVILAVFIFIIISILKEKKLAHLRNDFVNNMTHELKTPITNISVASDAIRNRSNKMDTNKLGKYADIIYNENNRLLNLVDSVLQISTIEKQEESFSFQEIDVHAIINKVLLSFEPIIEKKEGSIKAFLEAKKYTIRADETHFTNVVYNLIENAIKYAKVHPEITIKTMNLNNGINVEIIDKGIGMSKETQERIFEKFFRAESGNIHNTKGFGLGLSYVKTIIEKHLGKITFTSKENLGTTFTIFLPI